MKYSFYCLPLKKSVKDKVVGVVKKKSYGIKGEYKYKVTILRDSFTVLHLQSDGWIKLLMKVLRKMQKRMLKAPTEINKVNQDDIMIANLLRNYEGK